ncbi:MAG: hypothetical protein IJV65_10260 [Kiritimatiellae bacterium]|nr:hypothetical protein [Kiritimatiellia bacterium]
MKRTLTALVLLAAVAAAADEAPRPPARADEALETVRAVCSDVLDALLGELRARYPGIAARRSAGRSKKNDYRNYQWISVKFGEREYLLATHHSNLDRRTGNPHVQLGRVQFWRCEGPQGPHERDAAGVWRFRTDNEDGALPRTRVWDGDFSVPLVVDRFVSFLVRCGEGDALAALAAGADPATPRPAAPPPEERRRVDEAIETVAAAEADAAARIAAELKRRRPDWAVRVSHGNSRANDYRCYRWIVVETAPDDVRWITLFFNDKDPATGNTHTQFGRLQFWRGIERRNGPENEAGPHERDAGGWVFRSDRQWEDLPRLHLWSPEFSAARVADLFEEFVRRVPAR